MLTIWIIDEQDNYRNGIKKLLEIKIPNVSVKTFRRFNNKLCQENNAPDLMLIDPFFGYSHSLSEIDYMTDKTKVVFLSIESEKDRILELLSKDIHGFLTKDMQTNDLVSAIRQIISGKKYIHTFAGSILFEEYRKFKHNRLA